MIDRDLPMVMLLLRTWDARISFSTSNNFMTQVRHKNISVIDVIVSESTMNLLVRNIWLHDTK